MADAAEVESRLNDDLAAVRKTAAGWQTTVTALLGLFSLAGLALNKDKLGEALKDKDTLLSVDWYWFDFWAILALLCGVAAIVTATFASQGWPLVEGFRTTGKTQLTVRSASKAIRYAIRGLMISLGLAGGCILFLVFAIIAMYGGPLPDPKT